MRTTIGRIAVIAALALAHAACAAAAEIKVYSTNGVQAALLELQPKIEKALGHKLDITFAPAAMLAKRIAAGETPDLMILTQQSLDPLVKAGKAQTFPGSAIAQSGMSMVVRKGAPKPDIATPDAFKRALTEAKMIAYSDPSTGAASGVYFAKLLERMGLAEAMKAKTKFPPPGGNSANLVVSGEAELAIQQTPEVMAVAGVDLVGPLPAALDNITVFAAGVGAGSENAGPAKAVIELLHTPDAQAVFKARGLDPA